MIGVASIDNLNFLAQKNSPVQQVTFRRDFLMELEDTWYDACHLCTSIYILERCCPMIFSAVPVKLDLADVKVEKGKFLTDKLSKRMRRKKALDATVQACLDRSGGFINAL